MTGKPVAQELSEYQLITNCAAYDGCTMQRFADASIAVIGSSRQKAKFCNFQEYVKNN